MVEILSQGGGLWLPQIPPSLLGGQSPGLGARKRLRRLGWCWRFRGFPDPPGLKHVAGYAWISYLRQMELRAGSFHAWPGAVPSTPLTPTWSDSRFRGLPIPALLICCLAPHLLECWVGPNFNASPLLSKATLVTNYPCALLFLLFYKFINSKRP